MLQAVLAVGEGTDTNDNHPPWVWRSTDTGLTWSHIATSNIASLTVDGAHVYICGSVLDLGNNRVVLNLGGTTALDDPPFRLSLDAGMTFPVKTTFAIGVNHGGYGGQCFQMALADDGSILAPTVYGTPSGRFRIWRGVQQGTPTSSIEWSLALTVVGSFGSDSPSCGVCRIGAATLLAYAQASVPGGANTVYRSTDNGATWAEVASLTPSQYFTGRLMSPATNVAYMGNRGSGATPWHVYRTLDGGDTWAIVFTQAAPSSNQYPLAAAIGADNRCFIAGGFPTASLYDLLRSEDNGATWGNPVDIHENVDWTFVRGMGYIGNNVLVAGSFYNDSPPDGYVRLARSADNGATWTINAARLPGPIKTTGGVTALIVHDIARVGVLGVPRPLFDSGVLL